MKAAILIFVALPATVWGQVLRYEGDVFPEDAGIGIIRLKQVNTADRELKNDWLVLSGQQGDPCPPNCSFRDFYRRDLDESPRSG